jgi:hypothetical protein
MWVKFSRDPSRLGSAEAESLTGAAETAEI